MMIYAHRCRNCNSELTTTTRESGHTCACGGTFRRDFRFSVPRATPFVPHYNWSIGKYVGSQSDLDDGFKRAAAANSDITGTEHTYTQTDPDRPSPFPDAMELVEKRAATIGDVKVAP